MRYYYTLSIPARVASTALLLLLLLSACHPRSSPVPTLEDLSPVKTILRAEKAEFLNFLPDRRRIVHAGPNEPVRLLDLATGQDVPVPKNTTDVLDDELLCGEEDLAGVRYYFVGDLRSMASIRLEPLSNEAFPGAIRQADSIYALKTGTEQYELLLLQLDSSGNVSAGYYYMGARNLDILLAGIPYKSPPREPDHCGVDISTGRARQYPSPDGRFYYTCVGEMTESSEVRIYSQQAELLNSIASPDLVSYGWAWDSSGVYIQEYRRYRASHESGPLELLLANP